MAGDPDVVEKLKKGYEAIGRTYKNHIDGFNLVPYLTGKEKESPRKLFVYFSDDGDVLGIRFDNWKVVFLEQRCHGTMQVWAEPFTRLRLPKLFNLRTDPYEFADVTSNTYYEWFLYHAYILMRRPGDRGTSLRRPSRTSRRYRSRTRSPSTTPWRRCQTCASSGSHCWRMGGWGRRPRRPWLAHRGIGPKAFT